MVGEYFPEETNGRSNPTSGQFGKSALPGEMKLALELLDALKEGAGGLSAL